jgi:hypothetical protein
VEARDVGDAAGLVQRRELALARRILPSLRVRRRDRRRHRRGEGALAAGSLPAAERAKTIASLQRELRMLQRTHASETGAMLSVATKLRLTQQSRFQANSAYAKTRGRPPADAPRPWDMPDGRLDG